MLIAASILVRHPGASAQMGGDPAPHRDALERLSVLVGEWEGDGWVATRGGRQEIRQHESVRYALGGTILVIEGSSRARSGPEVGDIIFQAFAVVSWSPDDGYRVRSYLADGLYTDRTVDVTETGLSWEQPSPAGPIRYALHWNDGVWHESGWLSRQGGGEVPTMDFRLTRAGANR